MTSGSLLGIAEGLVHLSDRGSVICSGTLRGRDRLMGLAMIKSDGRLFPWL